MVNVNNAMLDLETLGNESGAIVVSIGAVKFDPEGDALGAEFYSNVDVQSCVAVGLTVAGATIKWWMEQPDETRRALFSPEPVPLREALSTFSAFYEGLQYIWSHGSTFDIPILAAAYRALNEKRPWEWRNTRDTRTLFSLVPQSVLDSVQSEGRQHHALHDAVRQARMVQAAYRWLGGR